MQIIPRTIGQFNANPAQYYADIAISDEQPKSIAGGIPLFFSFLFSVFWCPPSPGSLDPFHREAHALQQAEDAVVAVQVGAADGSHHTAAG